MIRRLLYRSSIGLATFAIGLSMTSLWNVQRPISLCELDANPDSYGGKTIRFRGIVDKTQYFISAYSFCHSAKVPAVSIELDPSDVANLPLPESVMSCGEWERYYLMDAVIVGQLDPYFGLGCFAPKYHISHAKVERVFSIQEFKDMEQAVEWTKSNSY